jgi:4-carboxymuconolactone decarboxylase
MAITATAQCNHDVLFPDHRSTLKVSDPELAEIFDNWAFDEVIQDAPLDVRLRLIVQLAALIASHAVAEYRVILGAALQVGVTPVEIKEIVYQAVSYTGMARAFDFIHVTNEVFAARGSPCPCPANRRRIRRRGTPGAWKSRSSFSVHALTRGTPNPARSAVHPALLVRQLLR